MTSASPIRAITRIGPLQRGHSSGSISYTFLMSEYESSLLGNDWTLRPEAVPRFQHDANGGAIGTVSEPQ